MRITSKREGWAPTAAFFVGATALHAALFATVGLTRRTLTTPAAIRQNVEYDVTLTPAVPSLTPSGDVATIADVPRRPSRAVRTRITSTVAPPAATGTTTAAASGVLAAAGTASQGSGSDGEGRARGAVARAVPAHSPPAVVPRHGPRLTASEACRRLFPHEARDDRGTVVIALHVGESGAVYEPRVLTEEPPRQGFARAALGCASLLRFEPAESAPGARIASVSVVRLRFARAALARSD